MLQSTLDPHANVTFWKLECRAQQKRMDDIGRPTDLSGELRRADAETALDECRRYFREAVAKCRAARKTKLRRAA